MSEDANKKAKSETDQVETKKTLKDNTPVIETVRTKLEDGVEESEVIKQRNRPDLQENGEPAQPDDLDDDDGDVVTLPEQLTHCHNCGAKLKRNLMCGKCGFDLNLIENAQIRHLREVYQV